VSSHSHRSKVVGLQMQEDKLQINTCSKALSSGMAVTASSSLGQVLVWTLAVVHKLLT